MTLHADYERNVFINCPFDPQFKELLEPLVFTILYLGFIPRIASERNNAGEQRINKICELIHESKLSIHDLSRLKAGKKNEYYRLNMPFELGIDYSLLKFIPEYSGKSFLVLGKDRYDYAKALSDIAGSDIDYHHDEPPKIVLAARNWLSQFMDNPPPSPTVIWGKFNIFSEKFKEDREAEHFTDDEIYKMPIAEYMNHIRNWITDELATAAIV